MKQVTITTVITDKGYTTEVEYKNKKYKKTMRRTLTGAEGAGSKNVPEFIKDNINDPYGLMLALELQK